MLSARAYSFRQKSRLAISLSWVGGYSNVIAFVACGSYASHVTGVTTNIGSYVAESDWMRALLGGLLWLSFFAGAVASALLTESARRRGMASKYIWPMALEMSLLTVFAVGLHYADPHSAAGLYRLVAVVSFAMGLQNATITKISGAVIRTTHLTGVTTDLGLEGTQFLLWCRDQIRGRRWSRAGRVLKVSQRHPSFLRVLLLASIIGSFLFGAVAGAFCYIHMGPAALAMPVVFLGAIVWIDYRKPIADVKEIDLLGDAELKLFGIVQALLPKNLGIWRVSCRQNHAWHQAPDFHLWLERVPHHWRVIVLALSPLTRFDRNSILDLENAVNRLKHEGRKLILAGITQSQYSLMVKANIGRVMEMENLCPDLEFAIARGIDLLGKTSHRLNGDRNPARELADAEEVSANED